MGRMSESASAAAAADNKQHTKFHKDNVIFSKG